MRAVAVMHLGKIVEQGPRRRIYQEAGHPYTQALLSAVPVPEPSRRRSGKRIILEGEMPSAIESSLGLPVSHPMLEGGADLRPGGPWPGIALDRRTSLRLPLRPAGTSGLIRRWRVPEIL